MIGQGIAPVNSDRALTSQPLRLQPRKAMAKFGLFATITAIVGALTFASMSSPQAGDKPCVTKDPKTEMIKQACAKGGQKAAKDAMKAFNKAKKIKSCNQCHAKLSPSYTLKKDAYEQYKKLGGK
jgi:hypothetical protein